MPKRDPVPFLLVAALSFCVLGTAGLSYWHSRSLVQSLRLQAQMNQVAENRARIQLLAAEAVEYSKRNPAIDPVLQTFNLKGKPAQAPALVKPPGK